MTVQLINEHDNVDLCLLRSDVRNGNHQELGWPQTAYGVSKIGVTLMTVIQQREMNEDSSKPDVVINAVSYM